MLPEAWSVYGIILSVIGAVWSLAWWLSSKFTEINKQIYDQGEKIAKFFNDKLDTHEKHTAKKFYEVSEAIWEIKLRNAAVDGVKPAPFKPEDISG
jgi:hypothetical protein